MAAIFAMLLAFVALMFFAAFPTPQLRIIGGKSPRTHIKASREAYGGHKFLSRSGGGVLGACDG